MIFSTNTICESLFIYRSLCHTVCVKFGFKKAASHNTNYSLPRGVGWEVIASVALARGGGWGGV